jgi:hypothetical protein
VRGPVRHLSDAELDELARITPEDVERARQRWEAIASPMVRGLLDAVSEEGPDSGAATAVQPTEEP